MARGWHLSYTEKVDRFLQKVKVGNGCWEWQGFKDKGGYGRYKWCDRKNWIAHRLLWNLFIGDMSDPDIKLCHHCDNRCCVRPSHMFVGSQEDNIKDCVAKGRHRTGMKLGRLNRNAKLTDDKVREIRRLYSEGLTQVELGRQFGVAHTNIGNVLRKNTWKHVK